ncbi:Mechanosensory protein 2 [Trichinella papuae]|uniref:Mechanosensory protein 2 n=1 Tax=Trichinella papuae TaxID=268474 RepID=A0A0V1MA10_9BILA|nr:Mechanosensory protein 2 [Trichinella papuae]
MADDRDVCEEVRIPLNEDQIILTQHVTPMRISSSPGFHGLPSAALMKYPGDKDDDFGPCHWILIVFSWFILALTLPFSLFFCLTVVKEYERAVIFRLGRLLPGGARGPGIFFINPCTDTYRKVDLRVVSFDVPPQEILSKDSVTVAVDAVVYSRISNATISVINVEDAMLSTKLLAQTTLRNILGTKTLTEILCDREVISQTMQTSLDEATDPWGVKVERVEVKDVRLPVQLQRAMAAEAEATREARAKAIAADGEQQASKALKEAADIISQSPAALQLRYLQTLTTISAERNSTVIFPFPVDILSYLSGAHRNCLTTAESSKTAQSSAVSRKMENELNVDDFRRPWENDRMWNLRKQFILRNFSKMMKSRLICLSNVLVNIVVLGAGYDSKLTKEVMKMAGNLVEQYRKPIQQEAEKFLKPKKDQDDSGPPAKRSRTDYDEYKHCPSGYSKWQEPAICAKQSMLYSLRAQLSILTSNGNPMQKFNSVCNTVKCIWRVQLTDTMCTLMIDDVVVATQLYWGDEFQAKMDACSTAADILSREVLEVRRTGGGYELYTARGPNQHLESPQVWRLTSLTKALLCLKDHFLHHCSSKWRDEPLRSMHAACKQYKLCYREHRVKDVGLAEKFIATISNVFIYEVKMRTDRNRYEDANASNRLCTKSIECLMRMPRQNPLIEHRNGELRIRYE